MKRTCKPGHRKRMKIWAQKVKKIVKLLKSIGREEKSRAD